jgi:hypothetical protein
LEETLKRTFEEGYFIGYGLVLVLSILFMPRGILGLLNGLYDRITRKRPPAEAGQARARTESDAR